MRPDFVSRLRSNTVWFLLIPLFMFVACAVTGPGGKQSIILISTAQEVAIGAGMAEQVNSTEKVLPDPIWQAYINEIGQKIVAVSDRKDIEYHFTVIESDQINAFAAPGGYLYFYTGLLKEMNTEAEMVSVIAHEVSHVVGRHGIRRLQTAMGVALATQIVFGDDASEAIGLAVNVGMGLMLAGYSRDNERESDEFGMNYMVKAGYNPGGMIAMFDILASKGGSQDNVFENLLASHPDTQERIQNAKTRINEMQPLPANLTMGSTRFAQMKQSLP